MVGNESCWKIGSESLGKVESSMTFRFLTWATKGIVLSFIKMENARGGGGGGEGEGENWLFSPFIEYFW